MPAQAAVLPSDRVSRLPVLLRLVLALVLAVALPFATRSQEPAPPDPPSPIAIVPIDAANQSQVTGALQIVNGSAYILSNGRITSGTTTTSVVLPRRGVLRICASTGVSLTADKSVPAGETPGLMMALEHGAIEASFATGRNSDILLTPDFRILIGGPGASDLKVRLGEHGDTCVDNPGANAPYVLVSSVFEGGAYRVQPGQRVMFQHGSLKEVVDQEKEPCGCPAPTKPESNDFPLAESAGLAPIHKPEPAPPQAVVVPEQPHDKVSEPLVYPPPPPPKKEEQAAAPIAQPSPVPPPARPAPVQPAPRPKAKEKPGFFHSVGRFFRRIFGAD
ncbi:MAG TPA: hypothetical protein VGG85_03750 [Terracidiphilus sp.]|jgi:hypothetical protein